MKFLKDERGVGHILVALLIVVVIGAICFIGWRVHDTQKTSETPQTNTSTEPTVSTTPSKIIHNIQESIASQYKTVATDVGSSSFTDAKKGTVNVGLDTAGPEWQPAGYSYNVIPKGGSGINIAYYVSDNSVLSANQPIAKNLAKIITQQFIQSGLKKTDSHPAPQLGSNTWSYYKSSTIVCNLDASGIPVFAACDTLADIQATAPAFKPFAQAYEQSSDYQKYGGSTIAYGGTPTVKQSKTPGYQTASVGMGQFAGLFYKKDDGNWQYVMGVQGIMGCSDYTQNNDVRLAFLGTSCMDDSTQQITTVQ